MQQTSFEEFPRCLVAVCAGATLAIYAIGLVLMARLGIAWAVGYAAYCFWMEWRVLRGSCRSCHYYGKRCGFGRGVICSWLFRRTEWTLDRKRITWWSIVPDFLVMLIPLVAGIALLIRDFSWLVLFLVVVLGFLGTAGTGLVRGKIACRYCRQRELGCPAEQLFGTRR